MSPASRRSESRTGPSAAQQGSTSSNNNINNKNDNNNHPNTGNNVVDPSSLGPPTITSDANLTGSGTRHLNHNAQGSGNKDGRLNDFSNTPFVSRDHFPGQLHVHTSSQGHPTASAVNPYWPQYHQPSQSSTLPPNHHISSTQHTASTAPQDNRASIKSAPAHSEPQRMGPPSSKPNLNQVHAQTHPWRIKVYNACLACRKKKIKCDGQPTCQRCARLGFECSYIEVPPQAKNAKQKQKPSAAEASASASASAQASGSSSTADNAPGLTTKKSMTSIHSQTNVAETAKEIRQQRRPSTKDAASGSFPHASSRRSREPPSGKALFGERSLGPTGSTSSQAPKPELRPGETPGQLASKPMTTFVMDRDALLPDLYHILVNSVTIPNMAKQTSPSSTARPGGVLVGMDQLRLALASPIIPAFTVPNADLTDPEQQHSSFQKDPSTSSLLDQSTPLGFVITNKSVIQYLVHVYFECFHPHWMIVDKEKFLAQLRDRSSPPDSLLLVAICAAGAKYSDHEGLCADPGNLATVGDQFLTHARILLQDRFDMPSMSTLQALLILYWCQVQTGRASLRFMYVGMAIRMAQEMGLNRPLDPKRLKEMDEREVQIRKTIWWSCYQADRWTSAALGKPMVISDVDCMVDYPSSLNESDRYNVQLFRHMTDLAKILGKVILNLYTSTNAATCSSAIFSHLDQSLTTWIESLPMILANTENGLLTPTLQDSAGTPNTARSSGSQRRSSTSVKPAIPHTNHQDPLLTESSYPESSSALLYHTVRIILYRPFLHNSALAPALPLTLQSPLARCRESAVAISEIAEKMVTEQRSYRQLFNSIHISLCAAATVHRFVIVSQYQQQSGGLGPSEDSMVTSTSSMPATLSKAPMHTKTDLYFLALLLRILRNCCRFSIEKNLLGTIIEHFIPHKHLSPQDIAWAQEEVQKTLTIVPFSTRLPLLSPTACRSSASGTAIQQTILSTQLQQESVTLISQPAQQQSPQEPLPYHIQTQQFQQYQLSLRQHQEQQQQQQQQQLLLQQSGQQGPARHRQSSTVEILSVGSNHAPPLGSYTSSSAMADDPRQTRSSSRASSSMSGPSEYVATMVSGAFSGSSENERLQQYQHELDALHQHHRNQQSELRLHHRQQTLQLEQAQIYQQNQQQPWDQPDSSHHSSVPTQPSSDGVASPTIPYSTLSDPIVARNKRQGEASSKRKQAKQKQHDTQYENLVQEQREYHQHQQYHQHPGYQQRPSQQQPFQQPIQTFTQTDSYMTDMDQNLALGSVHGMAGSDELMTSTSAPSVVSQVTGATDLSGASDINSLDELLGIETTGYYSEIPATDTGDDYTNMDSTGLSLTGSSVEGQNQGHPTESSNNSDTMWHPQRQRPSLTGSSCGSNTNNSPSRGSHTQRNSMSENISDGSLQYILTNNNNNSGRDSSQGRYHGGSGTSTPGPMSMATTWFGIDHMNPDGSNQLPPLNPPRRSESPAGYPYPYAFSYAPQQPVPYVGYSSMGRSIAFSPGPPYVYAADNSGAMGVYLPAPGSQMTHGHPANDPAALGWQSHIQLAPPQQPIVAQVMQPPPQPGYAHEMYASRMPGPIYSGSQFPQQGHAQIIHYVQVQAPVMHQPSIQLAPLQTILQDPHPQQPQHPQHPHRQQPLHSPTQPPPPLLQDQPQNIQLPPLQPLTQHQQQQILPPPQQPPMQPSSQQRPQDSQRQEQRPQHQPKQNRPEQQVRHPSATLLPPLPPNVLREESGSGRSFSPTSSNSTLVNTTSISNSSNSQRESSSSSSFGRETSSGGESTSRSISAQLESSGQSGTSRSDDTSPGASNESSSTTESPNSTEDVSNSNESGSSSDNVGSRSSSADPTALIMGPIAAGTGDTSSSSGSGGDGSTGEENDTRTGAAGTGSSNGGGLEGGNNSGRTGGGRRRRAKKSVSPSGSGDSSTSSNPLGSVPNSQAPPGRHYRAHHPGQDGSRMAKPNDETQSTSSGTGSVSRSDTMSIDGTHQGRRKHKTTFPSRNLEDASNGMLDSNARGGHTSKPSGRRNQRKVSGGGGGVDGVGDSGSGGSDVGPPVGTSRPRADSDSAGSGSGSGSNSGTLHDSSGKGTSSGTGSTGGNSISSGDARKGRLNRKGKSKRGKGKTNPQAQQQQQQQDQEQQQAPKQAQGQQKQQPRTS